MPVSHTSFGAESEAPNFGAEWAPNFPLLVRLSAPIWWNRSRAFPIHAIHTIHISQTIQIHSIKGSLTVGMGFLGPIDRSGPA